MRVLFYLSQTIYLQIKKLFTLKEYSSSPLSKLLAVIQPLYSKQRLFLKLFVCQNLVLILSVQQYKTC
jgi:hypothetical protein